nr:MAG TPA: hypothetical protein [Caudoviricetes sp.]
MRKISRESVFEVIAFRLWYISFGRIIWRSSK